MTNLAALLYSIPDVVWSGLIAAALTLSGVLISNRSNTNRLRIQLQHDANEKQKDRTANLRREVYLRTAEELVKTNAHLATLPQIDLTKTNLGDGMQGFFAAAARLQLIAEPHTALLVSKLAGEYGELGFKLMTHLMPASKSKTDIQIADDLYSKAQAEVSRILGEMARLNESGHPDAHAFQVLQTSFDFQQSQAAKHGEDRTAAWKAFNRHQLAFQRYLLTELRGIGSKQIPVMIEIRRDLGLTGDLAAIEQSMRQQWMRMEARFEELIAALGDG